MRTGFNKLALALLLLGIANSAALAQRQAPFGQAPPAATPQATTPPAANTGVRRSGPGGPLYIAGDGFSLEQAIDDGIRESGGRAVFAVLVLGAEISKLGFHGATAEVSAFIAKANKASGVLYVCERDMKRQSFAASDFLPGVQIVRGFSKAEAEMPGNRPGPPGAAPLAPLFRMRAICAE